MLARNNSTKPARNSSLNVPRLSFIDRLRGKGAVPLSAPSGSPSAIRVHSDDTHKRTQALSVRSVDGGKRPKSGAKPIHLSPLSASLGSAELRELTPVSQHALNGGTDANLAPGLPLSGTAVVSERADRGLMVPSEGRAGGIERASSSPAKARSQLLTRLTSIDETSKV